MIHTQTDNVWRSRSFQDCDWSDSDIVVNRGNHIMKRQTSQSGWLSGYVCIPLAPTVWAWSGWNLVLIIYSTLGRSRVGRVASHMTEMWALKTKPLGTMWLKDLTFGKWFKPYSTELRACVSNHTDFQGGPSLSNINYPPNSSSIGHKTTESICRNLTNKHILKQTNKQTEPQNDKSDRPPFTRGV